MYSIHFHITMLDISKPQHPTTLKLPGDSASDLQKETLQSQHPLLISPINNVDSNVTTAFPSAH